MDRTSSRPRTCGRQLNFSADKRQLYHRSTGGAPEEQAALRRRLRWCPRADPSRFSTPWSKKCPMLVGRGPGWWLFTRQSANHAPSCPRSPAPAPNKWPVGTRPRSTQQPSQQMVLRTARPARVDSLRTRRSLAARVRSEGVRATVGVPPVIVPNGPCCFGRGFG